MAYHARTAIRVRIAVLAGTAGIIAGTLAGAVPAGAGVRVPASPHAGQTWTRVTATGLLDFADIGLVRGPKDSLHVVWGAGQIGKAAIYDTPISAQGVVSPSVVISRPFSQTSFPDATASANGTLHAFWNEVSLAGPRFSGTSIATWPAGGKHWDPISGVTPTLNGYWAAGIAAATGADGKPWVAFIDGGGFEVLHVGHVKRHIKMTTCCVYNVGIGVDDKTSTAWLTWYQLVKNGVGYYARQLEQNGHEVGGPFRLPGAKNAAMMNQRTTAVGIGPGNAGVYVSYPSGNPVKAVDLLRLGASKPVKVTTMPGVMGTTLASDNAGHIWVAWYRGFGSGYQLFVRRTAADAGPFGPVEQVSLPKDATTLWKAYISAQPDRLDIVALLTVDGKIAYWATQAAVPKSK
jgi:hypothetical protein